MAVNKRLLQGAAAAGGLVPSENFKAVLYTGNGSARSITGVGFQPDFVWIKGRTNTASHQLFDSTRGATKGLNSDSNTAEFTNTGMLTSFDSDGFSLGNHGSVNNNGTNYVAWCWKANGGTTSSNTDGSQTTTVQANTAAGISIITGTMGSSGSSTFGHGLGVAPKMIIHKDIANANAWMVYHESMGAGKEIRLNETNAATSSTTAWGNTAPTTTVYTGGNAYIANAGANFVAYCFAEIDGFSKFGSYTGTGGNLIVETGFEPAFLMVKRTDAANYDWYILDNKRNPIDYRNTILRANLDNVEQTVTNGDIDVKFLSNGFAFDDIPTTSGGFNASGGTYLYMAFAADPDTEAPTLADSFSTVTYTGDGTSQSITGLGFSPSLVWLKSRSSTYFHSLVDTVRGAAKPIFSNSTSAQTTDNIVGEFLPDGFTTGTDATGSNNGSTYVAWAWKADDNEPTIFGGPALAVYKFEDNANDVTGDYNGTASNVTYTTGKFNKAASFNGSSSKVENSSISSKLLNDYSISFWVYLNTIGSEDGIMGLYTSNTNDGMSLAFANGNLILNAGDGQSQYNPGSPILSTGQWQHIVITLKDGGNMKLYIDGNLQTTLSSINNSATSSSILRLGLGSRTNNGLYSYNQYLDGEIDQVRIYSGAVSDIGVAALYAETVSDNDDLTLGAPPKSIVSANANAGFSIVKWEGTGGNATVPHGLSAAPEMMIIKSTSAGGSSYTWGVYHTGIGPTKYLELNYTNAAGTASTPWNNTAPTSTMFNLGSWSAVNALNQKYIAYCFHSVSGYSKFGSYTGNGGTLNVDVGFAANFVMVKRTSSTGDWYIFDSVRGNYKRLFPNLSNAEDISTNQISLTSTGFTSGDGSTNISGSTYIYMAFKMNPTPYPLAGNMSFLVVAGGGSGGARDAGPGGAGGLRTSYGGSSGGGASAESDITLAAGTYTITVGSGGAKVIEVTQVSPGNSGTDSSIAATGLTTITSIGGGGGGTQSLPASSGGSGGGGTASNQPGAGTSGQGYAGGYGTGSYTSGGGGGASETGNTPPSNENGGAGGDGLAVSITGSSVTYAGGGGGCGDTSSGAGGAGGGGAGQSNASLDATSGTANTGGGGGSHRQNLGTSGAGGSGVVILRLATSEYSGTTTGSPTVTTDGDYTVLTYTGSGTYVHS